MSWNSFVSFIGTHPGGEGYWHVRVLDVGTSKIVAAGKRGIDHTHFRLSPTFPGIGFEPNF